MSASDLIRKFATTNPVFGSDEIRTLHGQKTALLVTALAGKGEFARIRNGVFGPPGANDTHPAYQDYLDRIHQTRVERSKLPGAGKADRFFTWAAEHGEFSIGEATRHFGEEMKNTIAPYVKRGTVQRVAEGRYLYNGPRPAARREAIPMAEPTDEETTLITSAINDGVLTAAQLTTITGINAPRLRAVLAWMANKRIILFNEPTSTNAHRTYRLPNAVISIDGEDEIAVLAIIATTGVASTRSTATHKIPQTPSIVQKLLAAGLIERAGHDEKLGGTLYAATRTGLIRLSEAGRQVDDVNVLGHRPAEREVLLIMARHPGIGYAEINALCASAPSLNQTEITALRLVKAGLLVNGTRRPVSLQLTQKGQDCLVTTSKTKN